MKNKLSKLIMSIVIVMCVFGITAMPVNAEDTTNGTQQEGTSISGKGMKEIVDAHKEFKSKGNNNSNTTVEAFLENLLGLGQVLVIIGGATLLIVGGIMAIKWITATPDKQAKLKTQSIGLVLAAVIIFGAVGIWNFVRNIMNSVDEEIEKTEMNNKEIVYYING